MALPYSTNPLWILTRSAALYAAQNCLHTLLFEAHLQRTHGSYMAVPRYSAPDKPCICALYPDAHPMYSAEQGAYDNDGSADDDKIEQGVN